MRAAKALAGDIQTVSLRSAKALAGDIQTVSLRSAKASAYDIQTVSLQRGPGILLRFYLGHSGAPNDYHRAIRGAHEALKEKI